MLRKDVPNDLLDLACDAAYGTPPDPSDDRDAIAGALAAAMPSYEAIVRARVSAEILAARDSLPVTTIDEQILQTGMVLAARVATVGPTRAPVGTGDAHSPGRGRREGSGGCEAS